VSGEHDLLAAVLDRPDDDTPRLAFADWSDEHGEPDRAALIRDQIATGDAARFDPRAAGVLPEQWAAAVRGCGVASGKVRRGFVAAVRLSLAAWAGNAAALLARWPLEWVEVADVPGLAFEVVRSGSSPWAVRGALGPHPDSRVIGEAESVVGFDTRAELVAGAGAAVRAIVGHLRTEAGERWPG
jgi:uncharacterized protein (TIGR02996 family)